MSEEKEKPKLPSFATMAKNFANDLTKYIKEGAPNVSPSSYEARLDACKSCPSLLEKTMRCGLCGCLIEHKAKWKTTTCPANPPKWNPEIILTDEQHKKKPNPKTGN